ncbi:LOW QUALITY PROTEIN: cytochrome P450 71D10-like [Pistacia vera]|uniref:LOW QUALITY PROTEIN: cytochrome P450 71D10-like n=1 Tax=Pistacia vera TaxID=55513 RepID=UPI0012639E40|nr:LOW QUALITY PROTEIN: cytochrome P450 71D10-like [Pistacia vera]
MEFHIPSFNLIISLLLFSFMAFKIIKGHKSRSSSSKMPPGPWKLPLIGNLHQLIGSQPHRRLRDLAKKHGPLMHLQLGEVSTVVVSSAEIAREVLKTHDLNFADRPFLVSMKLVSYDHTDIAFAPYGNYWRQLRKIATIELLSARRVQSLRSVREEEVSNLIKAIQANEGLVINLSDEIVRFTYGVIVRLAFRERCKDEEAFLSCVLEVIEAAAGFSIVDFYPSVKAIQMISGTDLKLEKLHQKSDGILENILNDHKEKERTKIGEREVKEDLVDVLLRVQREGDLEFSLTDNNIKAVIWDIFSAGSEKSSTALQWAMLELLRNPRVMKEAQAEVRRVFDGKGYIDENGIQELKYLKSVIKETMRLHAPVPLLLPRECRESCEINGYTIPEKTRVVVNGWAIGRDPGYWNDAETFYPERFLGSSIDFGGADFEYIQFRAGRRICPGLTFALPNIELPLAQLLYHFDWKLPNRMNPKDLDMAEVFGVTLGRKTDLMLIPIPYCS